MSSFSEFLKGTHVNSGSDIKYLPKELIYKIWIEYAASHYSDRELLEMKLLDAIKIRVENRNFFKDKSVKNVADLYNFFLDFQSIELLKFLVAHYQLSNNDLSYTYVMLYLAKLGNLELIKYVYEVHKSMDQSKQKEHMTNFLPFQYALKCNHITTASWMYDYVLNDFEKEYLRDVDKINNYDGDVLTGDSLLYYSSINLTSLEWAYTTVGIRFSIDALKKAIFTKGIKLEILNWLKDHIEYHIEYTESESESESATDRQSEIYRARLFDHVQDVKTIEWICTNLPEYAEGSKNCYTNAFASNNFEVISWLLKNRPDLKMDTKVFFEAASRGHLSILIWLFEFCKDKFQEILDVNFVFRNVITSASFHGHLHVVKWAYKMMLSVPEKTTNHALNVALQQCNKSTALWLKDHKAALLPFETIWFHILHNNIEMLKFIQENHFQLENTPTKKDFYNIMNDFFKLFVFALEAQENSNGFHLKREAQALATMDWILGFYSYRFEYSTEDIRELILICLNSDKTLQILARYFDHFFPNFQLLVDEEKEKSNMKNYKSSLSISTIFSAFK